MSLPFGDAFVINLEKDKNRYEDTQQQFQSYGIPIRRIEGVYGEHLVDTIPHRGVTAGMLGCAASHVKAWKTMLQSNLNTALIVEDDVMLESDFAERLIKAMKNVPSDYDIVYLGCIGCNDIGVVSASVRLIYNAGYIPTRYVSKEKDVIEPRVALGLHCYIVSRKGAMKLVQEFSSSPVTEPVDVAILRLRDQKKIKAYVVNPLLAYQKSTGGEASSQTLAPSTYPMVLNYLARQVSLEKGLTLEYAMNAPLKVFGKYTVNAWTITFLAVGLLLGLRYFSTGRILSDTWLLIILVLLALPDIFLGNASSQETLIINTMILFFSKKAVEYMM